MNNPFRKLINRYLVPEQSKSGTPRSLVSRATVKQVEDLKLMYRGDSANRWLNRFVDGYVADAALFNARNLAAVPLRLYQRVSGNGMNRGDEAVEITDHEVLKRLRRPDTDKTAAEWHTARFMDKQLYGAYYLLDLEDDVDGTGGS